MKIYSLFDRKVGEYGGLVLAANDDTIKRALRDGLPPNSTEAKYPNDFDLVCLGEFDAVTGALKAAERQLVGSVADIKGGA